MSEAANGMPYWGRALERRIEVIERIEPAVLAEQVRNLTDDVRSLKRAFYAFAFSVVGSSIVFAFTVFALLGKS